MAFNLERVDLNQFKGIARRWWLSVCLLPFIGYHLHQAYWTLRFNIFFSYNYDFPFPINIVNLFVQNFHLIVHEAGHTFSSFVGYRTFTILGGSLYEIMLPAMIVGYLAYNKYLRGTQLGFYLLGTAWMSVAFYAADGAERQLPLIGNLGDSAHDWGNLLTKWGLLQYDGHIGVAFALTGAVCFLGAIMTPLWLSGNDVTENGQDDNLELERELEHLL
jgi:hypothetical protein